MLRPVTRSIRNKNKQATPSGEQQDLVRSTVAILALSWVGITIALSSMMGDVLPALGLATLMSASLGSAFTPLVVPRTRTGNARRRHTQG
jgi:hypothetical protein